MSWSLQINFRTLLFPIGPRIYGVEMLEDPSDTWVFFFFFFKPLASLLVGSQDLECVECAVGELI